MPDNTQKAKKNKTKNQSKAKRKPRKRQGDKHFCWVCGQHKAHEKFTGRGHATHMCKACKSLPVAERNEMVAVRKAGNMAFRYLNEQEINWLRKKMKDPRPEVSEIAQEVHRLKFPRQERNMIKKGLTAFSLELFIHGEVWSEWGDEVAVNMLITMERDGTICRTDYDAPKSVRETKVVIDEKEARAFLKSIIHEYDALFWNEDFSDSEGGDFDPYLDFDDDVCEDEEADALGETKDPIFTLTLELNNGEDKRIVFYNQIHDTPQDLFWALMEWFELDDELDCENEFVNKA